MAKKSFHVVPHEQGWALKEEGHATPVATFNTQREAIEEGRNQVSTTEDDEVDIVVHRKDGRVKERLTFTEPNPEIEPRNGNGRTKIATEDREKLRPADVTSVGSRVSWRALVAGAVAALSILFLLSLVGTAVGLTIMRQSEPDSLGFIPAIWAGVTLLISLFLGGYVTTRVTVGETHLEAALYGVLLWGTLMAITGILSAVGTSAVLSSDLGPFGRYGQYNRDFGHNNRTPLNVTNNQDVNDPYNIRNPVTGRRDIPQETVPLAWIALASAVLSLLAAVGGALLGAGPELVFLRSVGFRRHGDPRTRTTTNVRAVEVKEPVGR